MAFAYLSLGEKMKNLGLVLLLVAVIAGGYLFINKTDEQTEIVSTTNDELTTPVDNESTEAEQNMTTPADMSEKAQDEMYGAIYEYNKCMMENRLEYHQQGIKVIDVADKTLAACETHLDTLADVLAQNNVNEGLSKKMVHTMRSRAARKLMSAMMQSIAGQAAAMANIKEVPAE